MTQGRYLRIFEFWQSKFSPQARTRMIFAWYDNNLGGLIRYVFLLVNPLGYPENTMNRAPKIIIIVDFAIPRP